jgi:hypothetical protein
MKTISGALPQTEITIPGSAPEGGLVLADVPLALQNAPTSGQSIGVPIDLSPYADWTIIAWALQVQLWLLPAATNFYSSQPLAKLGRLLAGLSDHIGIEPFVSLPADLSMVATVWDGEKDALPLRGEPFGTWSGPNAPLATMVNLATPIKLGFGSDFTFNLWLTPSKVMDNVALAVASARYVLYLQD